MPRRKQDVFDQRRQQIIDGALKVFSSKGFAQATNKDVAEAAGINSPGLIYHYFKDKADLLRAVVEQHAPPMQLVTHSDEMMALPPAEALTRFGLAYLRLTKDPNMGAAVKLIMSEALRDPEFARVFGEIGPLRVWRFLETYLKHQMDQGVLRRTDAHLAARCFVGPLVLHLITRSILQFSEDSEIEAETLVALNVEIFLQGLQAVA
jgi:TetR/AcrR family transcriptional regulator, mexJK operon transcriptional repressor